MLNDPELQFEDADEDSKKVDSVLQNEIKLSSNEYSTEEKDDEEEEDDFSDYDEDFKEVKGPNSQVFFGPSIKLLFF